MEFEAPSIKALAKLREKLKPLGIPIYFNLPDPNVLEPFMVIGQTSSDTSKTVQTGLVIEDMSVQVDIFLPGNESRGGVERVRSEAIRRVGHNSQMATSVLKDETIGREVYHIVINLTEIIF
nr:MAG TPA: tail completion protein [Caudoviricetes sp.]